MTTGTSPLSTSDLAIGQVRRSSTLICAPAMAETVDQMLAQARKAKEVGSDLVEVRIDYLKKGFSPRRDLELLIKHSPLPTLVTYRPKWEGGEYDGDDNSRLNALCLAMELGADYIDVELKVASEFFHAIGDSKPEKVKIIVSSHNYEFTPSTEELGNLVARIQATGTDIVKIATTALDLTDSARFFQLLAHSQVPTIGLVMGERGLISRILAPKFGNPIGHSKSPHLYNSAFKEAGFNGIYLPFLVDDVAKFVDIYSSPDFVGYSYGIPHKMAGFSSYDDIDPVAKAIGAINCMIKRPNGNLMGCNVDYLGAIAAIEEGLIASGNAAKGSISPLQDQLFVVMGAGGAGKALAYGGKEKGARVVVANRTYEKAQDLAARVGGQALHLSELENFHPEEGMILVNVTSVGMKPNFDATPIPKKALMNYKLVFDAIYTPKWTRLLTEMLLNQAFVQFEKFTGLPAPEELTRQILTNNTYG